MKQETHPLPLDSLPLDSLPLDSPSLDSHASSVILLRYNHHLYCECIVCLLLFDLDCDVHSSLSFFVLSYFCPSSSSFMLQFLHMCVKTFRFLSSETTIVSVEVLSFLQRTTRERREKSIYIHHQYFCPCVFLVSIKFLLLSLVVSFLSCFSCHSFLSSLDLFLFTLIPHVSFLEQEVEGVSVDHKKSVFEGIFRSDRIFLFLWRCQLRDTSSL